MNDGCFYSDTFHVETSLQTSLEFAQINEYNLMRTREEKNLCLVRNSSVTVFFDFFISLFEKKNFWDSDGEGGNIVCPCHLLKMNVVLDSRQKKREEQELFVLSSPSFSQLERR